MDTTTISVRHVPSDVRDELAARARRAGQSLQEFMLDQIVQLAARPSTADLIADIRRRKQQTSPRVSVAEILADRAADRR